MNENPVCPECQCDYPYPTEVAPMWMCPECMHEWDPTAVSDEPIGLVIKDSNGNLLQDGDSVIVIKDLKVKGAPKPVKAGTKVKNIRLVDADHDIDCKIDGFGAMGLKSEFVRKA